MTWLLVISYIVVVIAAITAWINTKIIIEEIAQIKKHLGIPEDKPAESGIDSDSAAAEDTDLNQ